MMTVSNGLDLKCETIAYICILRTIALNSVMDNLQVRVYFAVVLNLVFFIFL